MLFLPFSQVNHHHVHHHRRHHHHPPIVRSAALASWYNDGGEGTACGNHLNNGFAQGIDGVLSTYWPCGTRAEFCYAGRCVVGTREDSGPYIAGRTFDLTPSLKANLRCPDLCHLRWRRLGS